MHENDYSGSHVVLEVVIIDGLAGIDLTEQ